MSYLNACVMALVLSVCLLLVSLLFPGVRTWIRMGYDWAMADGWSKGLYFAVLGATLVAGVLINALMLLWLGWFYVGFWVVSQMIANCVTQAAMK